MAEYIAFHPDNEVLGSASISALLALDEINVKVLLEKHNLSSSQDDWNPQQYELDLMRELAEGDFFNMIKVGMKITEIAKLPPEIQTVHQILGSMNAAYHMNVRGPDIGCYGYEKLSDRSARVICTNPYPSDFDYGLIYNFTRRFAPSDTEFVRVVRDDSIPNRKNGGSDTCIYTVEW
ncbi:MAG: hypothetical protein ACPG7F_06020 [Aggregatilineales bacterium]